MRLTEEDKEVAKVTEEAVVCTPAFLRLQPCGQRSGKPIRERLQAVYHPAAGQARLVI
jgi:hypothetical protein